MIEGNIEGDGGSTSFDGEYLSSASFLGAFGEDPYGFTTFGGPELTEDGDLLSFMIFKTLPNDIRPYEASFILKSSVEGDRWKVKAIGFNPVLQEGIPKKRKF